MGTKLQFGGIYCSVAQHGRAARVSHNLLNTSAELEEKILNISDIKTQCIWGDRVVVTPTGCHTSQESRHHRILHEHVKYVITPLALPLPRE